MPLDPRIWNSSQPDCCLPGATEAEFQAFEKKHNIQLRATLKELYRLQNGGMLTDIDDVHL